MAVSKVILNGVTEIDVTNDAAVVGDVRQGKTFHLANGTQGTGTIAEQAAQTITPTTTDQTIASGKYLTGAQTIKGDANLVAANIASGVTIFGVTGTHSGGGGGVSTVKCGEITAESVGMITIDTQYTGSGFPLGFAIFQMGGLAINVQDAGANLYAKINSNTTAPSQYEFVYSLAIRSYGTGSAQKAENYSAPIFSQNAASDNKNLCAVMSSADTLKVYFGNTQNSFKTNVRYCWVVAYSA